MTDYSKIKLIALDLDETTLNESGQLTKRTRLAIENAIKNGIHIVIASGRVYCALPKEVLEISGIEYAITSNGAAIYRISGEECILSYKINEKAVEDIIALKNRYPVTFEAFIDGIAYADSSYIDNPMKYNVPMKAKHYLVTTRKPVDDMAFFMSENRAVLDSIDIVVPSVEIRDELSGYIRQCSSEVYVTSSVPYLVEVADKRAGKGAALKSLCGMLGIGLECCAAFGNADNDIDMLNECAMGIAVANATQNCLAAADIIAPHHNDDGVAKIIEEMLGN